MGKIATGPKHASENVTANIARPVARPVTANKRPVTANVARPVTATVAQPMTAPATGPAFRLAASVPGTRGTKRPFHMVACEPWGSRLRPRHNRPLYGKVV